MSATLLVLLTEGVDIHSFKYQCVPARVYTEDVVWVVGIVERTGDTALGDIVIGRPGIFKQRIRNSPSSIFLPIRKLRALFVRIIGRAY